MKLRNYARLTLREARGSRRRLLLFMACLAVGVGAIVTVATLSASVDEGIRTEARKILGADVLISSRRPLPERIDALLEGFRPSGSGAIEYTTVRDLITLSAAPRRPGRAATSRLVMVKAIDGKFPMYGAVELDPPRPLSELLTPETTVVAPELLAALGLEVGDDLLIGGQRYRIAGAVLSEPQRLGFTLPVGPRVMLSAAGLERASTLGQGFGTRFEVLFRLPAGATESDTVALEAHLESGLPTEQRIRVSSYVDAQPRMRRNLGAITRFLGLVSLLSLLIGSVGVAQTVRAWIAERLDAIAVMRCLGMRPGEVMILYTGQTVLLGLAGSLLGAALGVGMTVLVPTVILPDLIPPEFVHPWQPIALIEGLVLGVGVSLLFSLPPLIDIRRIPPARVFRSEAEPLRLHAGLRLATGVILVASIWGAASWQARSVVIGAIFAAGLLVVVALLTVSALALSALASRLPREGGRVWLRHGLTRLSRPGAATVSSIVALGLGVMIVLTVHLVERHLTGSLVAELPDAPSCFLMNIRSDQRDDVRRILVEHDAESIRVVPIVQARIRALDGVPAKDLIEGRSRRRAESRDRDDGPSTWALRRDQRLTYAESLPKGNEVVEGALWSDPAADEISVEQDFAQELGVALGSTITVDVSGTLHDLTVTSIRSVDWRTVSTNFFLVVEPGVLDDAPQTCVASAELPPGGDQLVQNALAIAHPNVTLFKVRDIAGRVLAMLQRVAMAVQLLGAFTVAAGVLILAGSISAGAVRRGREVALLKTLGMTRRDVALLFAVEYALVGLAAAIIGGLAGGTLAWAVLTRLMEIPWEHRPLTYAATVAGTILLVIVAGLSASGRALAVRPIEVLRGP